MSRGKVEERPDEYEEDLHAHNRAGQHAGVSDQAMRTAYDVKELHSLLPGFRDDELKVIPVLSPGARLEQGAIYCDLRRREGGEFTAMGDQEAGPNDYFVPKSETEYPLWNRLIGVDDPARLDTGPTQP